MRDRRRATKWAIIATSCYAVLVAVALLMWLERRNWVQLSGLILALIVLTLSAFNLRQLLRARDT